MLSLSHMTNMQIQFWQLSSSGLTCPWLEHGQQQLGHPHCRYNSVLSLLSVSRRYWQRIKAKRWLLLLISEAELAPSRVGRVQNIKWHTVRNPKFQLSLFNYVELMVAPLSCPKYQCLNNCLATTVAPSAKQVNKYAEFL